MSYADYLRQPVNIDHIVESTTQTDSYGNPLKSVGDSISTTGFLEPVSESEQLVEAETYRTIWRLFLPADVVINGPDLVHVDGKVLQVNEVLPFINPRTGENHHIECRLTEVVG